MKDNKRERTQGRNLTVLMRVMHQRALVAVIHDVHRGTGSRFYIYCMYMCMCKSLHICFRRPETGEWSVLWTAQQRNVTFPDNMIQLCRCHSSLFTQLYFSVLKSSNQPRPINNGSPKHKKNNLAKVCLRFIRLRGFVLCLIVVCSASFNGIWRHPISFYPIWW